MQMIDAHLTNARWHPEWPDRLIGEIYMDGKNRFRDGETVVTSPAQDIGQGMFKTRSGTIYQVVFKTPANPDMLETLTKYLHDCIVVGDEGNNGAPVNITNIAESTRNVYLTVEDAGTSRRFRISIEEML